MSHSNDESEAISLSVRLGSLSREQLLTLLERLAGDSEAFAQRIDYLTRPRVAVERIATRIRAIRRDDESIGYDGLWEVADLVRGMTADIERDVLPHHPVQALALAEQVIALDAPLMNRSLDDGVIGDALKEACTLWLKSARAVRVNGALPDMNWEARVREVARQDDYGVRACLLRKAHMLFDEAELRAMAERLELQAAGSSAAVSVGSEPLQALSLYEKAPAVGMRDIAKALADPEMYGRAIRLQNPQPDDRTIEELARFHLDCGDVAGALRLLETPWDGYRDIARLELLDRAYGQTGDTAARIETRRERYRQLPCLWTYQALEEILDDVAREALREQVSAEAVGLRDVATATELLLATGAARQAQVLLLARAKELDHAGASQLEPMAKSTEDDYPLMATILWRALLNPILDRGASKAYRHAADYLSALRRLAERVEDYRGLPTHAEYEAQLRERHARKTGFWRQVALSIQGDMRS